MITSAPTSIPSTSLLPTSGSNSQAGSSKSVPVAAIAAPVVIGVLAIAGVIGLLVFLRRRKAASKKENPYAPPGYKPGSSEGFAGRNELEHGEVHEVESPVQEAVGDTVKYRHELETRPAELEGEKVAGNKK